MRAISARAAVAPPNKITTRRRRECYFCASRFRASSSSFPSLARTRRRRRKRCLKISTRAAALDNDVIETATTTALLTTTTSTSYEPTAFSDSLLEAGIEPCAAADHASSATAREYGRGRAQGGDQDRGPSHSSHAVTLHASPSQHFPRFPTR